MVAHLLEREAVHATLAAKMRHAVATIDKGAFDYYYKVSGRRPKERYAIASPTAQQGRATPAVAVDMEATGGEVTMWE